MPPTDRSLLRYNQVRQKSSHNAFENDEKFAPQVGTWKVHSLEFDIHIQKKDLKEGTRTSDFYTLDGDWFIYHMDADYKTWVESLKQLLNLLVGLQAASPNHEVMTIFLDNAAFKTDHQHTPEDLDKLLLEKLGNNIFTPKMLLNGAATLKEAVTSPAKGWPLLSDLRGKFIFVMTGPNVDEYVDNGNKANDRVVFIAGEVDEKNVASAGTKEYIIFYNFGWSNRAIIPATLMKTFVVRAFPSQNIALAFNLNTPEEWKDAKELKIHHIATNEINTDKSPFATTLSSDGWPFEEIT